MRELSHLEQLETLSDPSRDPRERQLATAYLGLVPRGVDPARARRHRAGTPSTTCPPLAFDHGAIVLAGRERLRAKLSYTNLGFALAPETFTISELRELYAAALGHDVSATNLQRVLLRRGVLEPTGERRAPGPRRRPAGGGLPLPRRAARDDRPVRGAAAAAVADYYVAPSTPSPGGVHTSSGPYDERRCDYMTELAPFAFRAPRL